MSLMTGKKPVPYYQIFEAGMDETRVGVGGRTNNRFSPNVERGVYQDAVARFPFKCGQ